MILEVKNIKGGYKKDVDILRGINLSIKNGEAVGIIGLNGSGKSTLGKSLMNMLPYQKGEILFNGTNISTLPTSEISRKGISIMLQGGKVMLSRLLSPFFMPQSFKSENLTTSLKRRS